MSLAGVDIGTTGCKCTIYDVSGSILGEAYAEYEVDSSKAGRELDPAMVWEKTKEVIQKAACHVKDLSALAVASFGEATALLDEKDHPVTRSILYTDYRGQEQCKKLTDALGREKIAEITGLNPHENYSIAKLMWIKEHMPEVYEKTDKILLYADYIVYMLTGERKIDYALATRTMAFDLHAKSWSKDIFAAAGIDADKMSNPVPTGTKAGYIKEAVKKELGLTKDVLVLSGCHDQIMVGLGTGVLEKGMGLNVTGTVECVAPIYGENVDFKTMYEGNYAKIPYFVPETFITYAYSFTGGRLLQWYRDEIAYVEAKEAKDKGLSIYDIFNEQLSDEPTNLLILPYFAGAATPYMNSTATGAIIGLTLETKSIDIYQALMEGVAFEMKLNMERMEEAGITITHMRASGGGARSAKWLQMKADIWNIPITSLGATQSGTLGCVMLAGLESGALANLKQAQDIFVKTKDVYYPRSDMHVKYMEKYQKYKKLYPALKEFF